MAEINDWNTAAPNNNGAPPDGFPEGMDYSDVNNTGREVMAVLARFYNDENGSLTSVGTNDITITTNASYAAYYQGLRIGFRVANTNTGAMTLQLNALTAVPFVNTAGGPMQAGSVIQGLIYYAVFNGSEFQLVTNGFTFPGGNPGLFSAASPDVLPALDDRVAITDTSDGGNPKFATVQAIRDIAAALFTNADPPAVPEATDRFHFQDGSDANNPKTATVNQIMDAGGLFYRSSDTSITPALGDIVPLRDVSDSNAARAATIQSIADIVAPSVAGSFNLEIFTTSGTYTKPSNLIAALVIVVAGGGSSGGFSVGVTASARVSGGGGAGGTSISLLLDADLAASEPYVVGAGGAGDQTAGDLGGDSSFGDGSSSFTQLSALGGSGTPGRTIADSSPGVTAGGLGGSASGGQLNIRGGGGGFGALFSSNDIIGGHGGATVLATPTLPNSTGAGSDLNGIDGHFPGGGGSGAFVVGAFGTANGGAGAGGAVIIFEFLTG